MPAQMQALQHFISRGSFQSKEPLQRKQLYPPFFQTEIHLSVTSAFKKTHSKIIQCSDTPNRKLLHWSGSDTITNIKSDRMCNWRLELIRLNRTFEWLCGAWTDVLSLTMWIPVEKIFVGLTTCFCCSICVSSWAARTLCWATKTVAGSWDCSWINKWDLRFYETANVCELLSVSFHMLPLIKKRWKPNLLHFSNLHTQYCSSI